MTLKKKVVATPKPSGSGAILTRRRANTSQTTNMSVDPKTQKQKPKSPMDVAEYMSIDTKPKSPIKTYRDPGGHYSETSSHNKTPELPVNKSKSKTGRLKGGVLKELSAQFARLATSDSANNAQVKAYTDEMYRRYILNKSRANYITKLKNKIYKGERGGAQNHELLSRKPALKTAIENAATRNANNLFLFPDTDPLVYRRQINIPNVTSHSPVFGF